MPINLNHLLLPPYLYFGLGALVLLCLLWWMQVYRRNHKGIIPFKAQGGSIEIAPGTLRGVIQLAAASVEGIEKASCQHFIRRHRLGVRVAVHVHSGFPLKDIDRQLKQTIRETLREQFGMEQVDPIHIRVARIIGDPVTTTVLKESAYSSDEGTSDEVSRLDETEAPDERPYADDLRTS
jgi:uncharacterized alkaline shock family protein YloU